MSFCLSVHPSAYNKSAPTARIFKNPSNTCYVCLPLMESLNWKYKRYVQDVSLDKQHRWRRLISIIKQNYTCCKNEGYCKNDGEVEYEKKLVIHNTRAALHTAIHSAFPALFWLLLGLRLSKSPTEVRKDRKQSNTQYLILSMRCTFLYSFSDAI